MQPELERAISEETNLSWHQFEKENSLWIYTLLYESYGFGSKSIPQLLVPDVHSFGVCRAAQRHHLQVVILSVGFWRLGKFSCLLRDGLHNVLTCVAIICKSC